MVLRKLFASWDGSPVSRLTAMRKSIFDQGDDTLWQKIGFKLNMYMNGGFVVFLYIMMLFPLRLDFRHHPQCVRFLPSPTRRSKSLVTDWFHFYSKQPSSPV